MGFFSRLDRGEANGRKAAALATAALSCALGLAWAMADGDSPAAEPKQSERLLAAKKEQARSAGAFIAAVHARRDCLIPDEKLSPSGASAQQARASALCQLSWRPRAGAKDERELRESLSSWEELGGQMAGAQEGYRQADPYATSMSAALAMSAILSWELAAIKAGQGAPEEAGRMAREALPRLKKAIKRDLAAGVEVDEATPFFSPRPHARKAAQMWADAALAGYWQTQRPEALSVAVREYVAAQGDREDSEFDRLLRQAREWGRSEREAIEARAKNQGAD